METAGAGIKIILIMMDSGMYIEWKDSGKQNTG